MNASPEQSEPTINTRGKLWLSAIINTILTIAVFVSASSVHDNDSSTALLVALVTTGALLGFVALVRWVQIATGYLKKAK